MLAVVASVVLAAARSAQPQLGFHEVDTGIDALLSQAVGGEGESDWVHELAPVYAALAAEESEAGGNKSKSAGKPTKKSLLPFLGACPKVQDVRGNRITFPKSPKSGGHMAGYRFDPEDGPSTTVFVALPGGGRQAADMDEFAMAIAEKGYSFVSLQWPIWNTNFTLDMVSKENANYTFISDVAVDFLAPVVAALRRKGAMRLFGFGWAMGNRFMRLAEQRELLFDGVVIAAAGHAAAFSMSVMKNQMIAANESLPEEVRYAAFAKNNFAPAHWNMTFGSMERAFSDCTRSIFYAFSVKMGFGPGLSSYRPQIAGKDSWTVINGLPMLILQGDHDLYAPIDTFARKYKEMSPETVTLVEVKDAGHFAIWEHPGHMAGEVDKWVKSNYGDGCAASCKEKGKHPKTPWNKKCDWQKCLLCEQCKATACFGWCKTHSADWNVKCGEFRACAGCGECDKLI